jgi:glucose/arabinose dehydrogenase
VTKNQFPLSRFAGEGRGEGNGEGRQEGQAEGAMSITLRLLISSIFLASIFLPIFCASAFAALPLEQLKLPPGFEIKLFAENVPNARSLALGKNGTVFVGTRAGSEVYAVTTKNGGQDAAEVTVIARGLFMPNGVAFRDGALYVAEVNRVLRFDNIEENLKNPPKPAIVNDSFPRDTHHGWKFIAFGPDGWLYVPVGAPCNVCEPDTNRYANIMRMKPDGSNLEVFASGVRNSVGFDWDPQTKELWFTDNGRDMLGDDVPPCELNHAPKPGMHFGFPYCHGGEVKDPEFGDKHPCSDFTPPAQKLGAHVAPLGARFYTGAMFPPEYKNRLFVAEHGSWNRSQKSGYRVMTATLKDNKVDKYEPFIEGWLQGQNNWGRPVDFLVMPDGALLLSDDQAGVIYRVTYRK